jgi:hypothetical protein
MNLKKCAFIGADGSQLRAGVDKLSEQPQAAREGEGVRSALQCALGECEGDVD